jgi:hypothetical protein
MRQAKYWLFLLPLFFVLVCVGAFAQANSEITGIVTDQTGAVVGGADITILDPSNGFTRATVSSPTGLYDIAGLNPGSYNLTVTAKGFEKFVQTGIVVNTSATFRVDAKLTLGAETQTVSVVADALAVQTDSNVVSTLINSEEISEIATENRNFVALAALGLGVSSGLPDSNTPGSVGSNFVISINGLRQSHNIWLIDGGESDDRGGAGGMQIQPSQDAIAEFQMLTSNYPPDYGISSGATISLSLKSGTKTFHGGAWEENRSTPFDADPYFNKYQKTKPDGVKTTVDPITQTTRAAVCGDSGYWGCVPKMKYNIYGFNIGGPLYIPHVYNSNKNKTFFFWNEEWRKTTNIASSNNKTIDPADHPTAGKDLPYVAPKFDSGRFLVVPNVAATSDYAVNHLAKTAGPVSDGGVLVPNHCFQGVQAPDPKTGTIGGSQCYTDSTFSKPQVQTIPSSLFDSNAILYLNSGILPAPTNPNNDTNQAAVSLPFKVRDDVIRVDHNFSDKWAILGHYIGDKENVNEGGPELGWCWCSYNTLTSVLSSPSWSAAIKVSGTITPNLLVEASINYDGNQIDITPGTTTGNGQVDTTLPSRWSVQPVVAAYTVTRKIWPGISGFGNYGTAEDTATEPYHNHADDYEPKIDVSYTLGRNQFKAGASYNRYTKNQMLYGDTQGDFGLGSMSNDSLMDMLLGLPSSYSQNQTAPTRHYINNTPSVYANDNWHVTPRLTLQLGVRFDALPHASEKSNLVANFVPSDYDYSKRPIYTSGSNLDPSSPDLTTFTAPGLTIGIPSYTNGMESPGYNSKYVTGYVMGSAPDGLVQNDFKTWQPRVGFSDDVFGDGKTVLRGGFGTFFERIQGNDIFDTATSSPFDPALSVSNPYFTTPGQTWNTIDPKTGKGAVTADNALTFTSSQTGLTKVYKAPAVAQFSLGLQREVAPSIIWVVQYVGNIAWHQNIGVNINNINPAVGNVFTDNARNPKKMENVRCLSGDSGNGYVNPLDGSKDVDTACHDNSENANGGLNPYAKYPGYQGIMLNTNQTNGTYNGFQTGLRVQNRWGLSGELDYTYSHEIDITSYDESGSSENISNPWNYKYDKGSGALDRRHILSANYIYKLPIATKSTGIVKTLVGGWELAGTTIWESGVISAPGNSAPYNSVGLGGGYTIRPNSLGKVHYHKSVTNWFDTANFVAPVPSWLGGPNLGFGNSGKDQIVGPSRVNFTTSLYKSFAIYGTARLELRFESFNTFNHTQFNAVNTSMSCANAPAGVAYHDQQTGTPGTGTCVASGTYGQLTGAQDPRNLELGAKFVF